MGYRSTYMHIIWLYFFIEDNHATILSMIKKRPLLC